MMRKDDVLRRTGTDWVVEGVTIACVVAILVSFGFYGHIDADEAFPMHYNAAGEVDGWGTRSALWIFGGVALAVCLLLTIGERFYKKFNDPVRVTEKNREWLWRLAVPSGGPWRKRPENIFVFPFFQYARKPVVGYFAATI